jgi:hypothetical protein
MTPVDVRIGFLGSGPVSFEPRFALSYVTNGSGHLLEFAPGLNVLYAFGARRGPRGLMGPYLTGGISLNLTSVGSGGTSTSATQLSINVGIGQRRGRGLGAFRPEAFFRYDFENASKGIPSSLDLGVRLGLSFFR